MKKGHKHKYKTPLGWDEELMYFIAKVIASTAFFFIMAIGIDTYRFFH